MKAASFSQPATGVLLHRRPYQENGFKCSLLTLEFGRLDCIFSGSCPEYFREFQLKLSRSSGLVRARGFRYIQPSRLTREEAFLPSFYLHELLYYLAPVQVNISALYGAYLAALVRLNLADDMSKTFRVFEYSLLQEIGQSLDFLQDSEGESINSDLYYRFNVNRGFSIDTYGRYSGRQILGASELDKNIPGAMALARECLAMQLEYALNYRGLRSLVWLRAAYSKGELK